MAEIFANRAESTLASGIIAGATSLTVQTGDGAEFPSTGDFSILLQDATNQAVFELVKATARTTDTITITATANAWDAGDKVVHVLDKRALDAALASKQALSEKGVANGYAPLGADSKVPSANLPASVLAVKEHQLAAIASTSSTSLVDVDATNLVVTFTAPASGQVIVSLEAFSTSSGGDYARYGLREGASDVAGSTRDVTSATTVNRHPASILVTGLTPGNSYTYKMAFSHSSGGANTHQIWSGAERKVLMKVTAV